MKRERRSAQKNGKIFFLMVKKNLLCFAKNEICFITGIFSLVIYPSKTRCILCFDQYLLKWEGQFAAVMSATFRTTRCPGVALTESSVIPPKKEKLQVSEVQVER